MFGNQTVELLTNRVGKRTVVLLIPSSVYAIGHISGAHLNPTVSIGLMVGGCFSAKELVPYIVAQVLGGSRCSGCYTLL